MKNFIKKQIVYPISSWLCIVWHDYRFQELHNEISELKDEIKEMKILINSLNEEVGANSELVLEHHNKLEEKED